MDHPRISQWSWIGRTTNSTYYLMEPGVLACVPAEKSTDDGASALENARFQEDYWMRNGTKGTCVIFFDQLADQTAEARSVYKNYPFVNQLGSALVGGSALSRAIASFFTGLSRPNVPTRFFESELGALVWCRELRRAAQ